MKKLLTATALVAAILFNLPAYAGMDKNKTHSAQAAMQQNAADSTSNMAIMTIEQVQSLGDDAPVMLEGMITQAMGDEMYVFQDPTGATIMVEIDDKNWNGLKPSPNDMVIITGETDKNGNVMEIDVETIAMK